jgi:hypothetical protein
VKVRAARGRWLRTAAKELQLNRQMFVLGFDTENWPAFFPPLSALFSTDILFFHAINLL